MELPIYERKECAASSKMGKGSDDGLRVLGSRVRLQGLNMAWHRPLLRCICIAMPNSIEEKFYADNPFLINNKCARMGDTVQAGVADLFPVHLVVLSMKCSNDFTLWIRQKGKRKFVASSRSLLTHRPMS